MGLPTWPSPEQMPRPYEVGKVQFIPGFHQAGKIGAVGGSTTAWIKIYNHIVEKGAVGESSTTRTRQNSWAEKTRLSRHSSFLVLAPPGSTGHHLCYHLVLRIFHEKKKKHNTFRFLQGS